MSDSDSHDRSELRRRVLSRWENEGGAVADLANRPKVEIPELTNTELVQLRIRVIALENLLIAVLAEGSVHQLRVAREMADHIAPRTGFTLHPLTIQAAGHITDLVDRAMRFRSAPGSPDVPE